MDMASCTLCPRNCRADRTSGKYGGVCKMPEDIYIARAALHLWEEPCITGEHGSGAVFFEGCPLKCIYCQNYEIAHRKYGSGNIIQANGSKSKSENKSENKSIRKSEISDESKIGETEWKGRPVSIGRLADIFLTLQNQQAANINLVTPTHYTPQIIEAVLLAKKRGLDIPIVYNCSGYEKVETLQMLEGIVDIYLTDFKYMDVSLAERFSHAADYPEVTKAALREMVHQQPGPQFNEAGIMQKGVIVRHLLLPGHVKNAKEVVKYVYDTYKGQVYLSLMNQYTPLKQVEHIPELNRRVTKREYENLLEYAISIGVEDGFFQEGETAKESFIPKF